MACSINEGMETSILSSLHGYPRPQLERTNWLSLDGAWDFALDPEDSWNLPASVVWNSTIKVPFAPETSASGIGITAFHRACWYRRTLDVPDHAQGERLILHFGAVDYAATVWVDDQLVATHRGGHTPFKADITTTVAGRAAVTIVVKAQDDAADLAKPRGKQDWMLEPHSIWYPRTTGIWQTVWLEVVPATSIAKLRWTPNVERWEIGLDAFLDGQLDEGLQLHVTLKAGTKVLADDTYAVTGDALHRRIALPDPGIDNYRNDLLWSPATPTLIDVDIELRRGEQCIDAVRSYTAMRSVNMLGGRFLLNKRPYVLRLVLDQGYWTESGLTSPNDDALRYDVELAKAMGFNGVRKHQKIEDPRYLYWADRLGLLVWEEMPSAYSFTNQSVERLTSEWLEALERDYNHPCIVTWVPFNESWGVPDLPVSAAQRHYIQALYHLTKSIDSTRPVSGNDGWESAATDIIGIHDYDGDADRIARRYAPDQDASEMLNGLRPGGRLMLLDGHAYAGQPIMLTEFGGIAFSADPSQTWGYSRSDNADEFAARYSRLLEVVRNLTNMSGYCYTQFADTYQESNGLLYSDRTPKFPIEQIAEATRGPRKPRELEVELERRERLSRQKQGGTQA